MANAALVVKFNKFILVLRGQGDGDTKWKGWSFSNNLLRTKLFILNTINITIILIYIFHR